tara:strand:- start:1368 stop:1667 length:300 start_codon:yes stop_codon:yes gene_type:complete
MYPQSVIENCSSKVHELVFTTCDRIESAYIFNELVRNRANAKKLINIGLEYGDINEALNTVEFKEFYEIYENIGVIFSLDSDKYKKAYKDLTKVSEYFN